MSIIERKKREKIELKKKILDTAYQLFIDKGYESISMRNIAQIIEYSTGTIYLYYIDKTELFYDIQQRLFDEYSTMLAEKLALINDPFERYIEMAKLTIQFSIDEPKTYYMMFLQKEPKSDWSKQSIWDIGSKTRDFLKGLIIECKETGHFKGRDADIVSYCSWASVHGIATTIVTNRMKYNAEEKVENRDLKEKMLNGAVPLFEEMFRKL